MKISREFTREHKVKKIITSFQERDTMKASIEYNSTSSSVWYCCKHQDWHDKVYTVVSIKIDKLKMELHVFLSMKSDDSTLNLYNMYKCKQNDAIFIFYIRILYASPWHNK